MTGCQFPYTEEFYKTLSDKSGLSRKNRERCCKTAKEFWQNCLDEKRSFRGAPGLLRRGLNLEKLQNKRGNLWSIRVSNDEGAPRIILAAYREEDAKYWLFAAAGLHDVYKRADKMDVVPERDYKIVNQNIPDEKLGEMLEGDFEEWMLWLYPEQKKYAEKRYRGAARIRGAAGTGKSVIGLHRAAYLATKYENDNTPNRILVTAFHKSAVKNLEQLYRRMPECPPNVDFKTIHQIAHREANFSGNLEKDDKEASRLFDVSWENIVEGSNIEKYGKPYIKEEIERVIHGRESTSEYLDTERVGRKISLKRKEREIVWQLYEDWEEQMEKEDTFSFAKVLRHAMKRREENPVLPQYRAVIVDEAQDMTYVAIRLVRTLVAERGNPIPENGLFLLEDLAQQIYAGGFRYSWSGIELDGDNLKTEVPLPGNYRNSRCIFNAATEVRGKSLLVTEKSHKNEDERASFPNCIREEGKKPDFRMVEKGKERPEILEIVKELTKKGFKGEEIGILCRVNCDAKKVQQYLEQEGVKCQYLGAENEEQEIDSIKITTFDSAKGLEFEVVIIPRIGKSEFPLLNKGREVEKEELQLELDRLYVAMTRPTKRLYLIADKEPCEAIMNAQDTFDGLWQPQV